MLASLAFGAALASGYAQVYTKPVGAITFTIPATNGAQTTTTYISLPLVTQPFQSALVTGVSATTLTVASSTWTPGSFAASGSPVFVKVSSGQQAGRFLLVTANTATTLTVDTTDHSSQTTPLDGSGFAVQPNDRIELIAGYTLASFFGDGTANNPLLLVGGANVFTADTVSLYNTAFNRQDSYFFNSSSNTWNLNGSAVSQNPQILYPDMAIGITRRPNRPALTFTVTGNVPEISPLTKTVGGNTSVISTSTRFPVDMPLSSLSIAGWTKSNSVFTADTISLWNQNFSRWDIYYQQTNGQWRLSGDVVTDQSGVVIPAGSGFRILKRSAVTGQSSFLVASLPYVLN